MNDVMNNDFTNTPTVNDFGKFHIVVSNNHLSGKAKDRTPECSRAQAVRWRCGSRNEGDRKCDTPAVSRRYGLTLDKAWIVHLQDGGGEFYVIRSYNFLLENLKVDHFSPIIKNPQSLTKAWLVELRK